MRKFKLNKISFCTTCMNRFDHLKETLSKNISDNLEYPAIEFIILDYNSTDNLESWMQKNFHLWHGKVSYYKTTEPESYARSHSRNMAFRLATGDILCNLDADNYTGNGFAYYINQVFNQHQNIYLAAKNIGLTDVLGKVCFRKQDFEAVQGYDEKIAGYGFEDYDIKNRLKNLGLHPKYFNQKKFMKVIAHDEKERVKNEFYYKNLKKLFVQKSSPYQARILFSFKDSTFESAEVLDSLYAPKGDTSQIIKRLDILDRYSINSIKKGIDEGQITFTDWEEVKHEDKVMKLINFYSQLINKLIMKENLSKKTIAVNENGYGSGVVYKNFDYINPIKL